MSEIQTKKFVQASASIKMIGGDDDDGTFEGIVSVFGNVDSYGDVMMPGAFTRTLGEWQAKEGATIPMLWMHDWNVPPIGYAMEAAEVAAEGSTPAGLYVKGQLLLDDSELARNVYGAMKAGAQREFSFGYFERAARQMTEDDQTLNAVLDVDLFEFSAVFRGANPETTLIGVKSNPIVEVQTSTDAGAMRRRLALASRNPI